MKSEKYGKKNTTNKIMEIEEERKESKEEKNETLEMNQKKSNWNLFVVQLEKRLDSEDQ